MLVRQKPGSAKGVMFITVEDETGVANLVVWPAVFERQRRLVLSAGMLACRGRVQREGEVVHVIAHRLEDLSDLLRGVGERGAAVPRRPETAADPRGGAEPGGRPERSMLAPELRVSSAIKVPTRDFR